MVVSDVLSRSQLPSDDVQKLEIEANAYVESINDNWPVSDTKMDKIRQYTKRDMEMQKTMTFTNTGWAEKLNAVSHEIRSYFPVRADVSIGWTFTFP